MNPRRFLPLALLLVLLASPVWAAVAFDAAASGNTSDANATSGNFNITIGAGSNRAVVVGVACSVNVTGMAGNVGGATLSTIASTTSATGTMLVAVNPPTGVQTVSLTWTNNGKCAFGAIAFSGVNQAAPTSGGTTGSHPIAVTSVSGDMTTTIVWTGSAGSTSDRDDRYNDVLMGTGVGRLNGDTGPGTGSTTHTYTAASIGASGANVVQSTAGGCRGGMMRGMVGC
jgi:hypothetical protein